MKRIGVTVNVIAPRAETRMTQSLIEQTKEEVSRRNPDYAAALVTWLASEESSDISGRFFEAWGWGYAVLEGTRHGARTEATLDDPGSLGESIRRIVRNSLTPVHFNRDAFYDL